MTFAVDTSETLVVASCVDLVAQSYNFENFTFSQQIRQVRLVLAKLASPSSVRQKRQKNVILPNVTCLLLTS
jgi:hypothetical protein